MKATININMDNDSFGKNGMENAWELSRILTKLSDELIMVDVLNGENIPIRDSNGNKVGEFIIHPGN